jgi:chorismate dehydratase
LEEMLQVADGALLIGDAGMKAAEEGVCPSLDLGEEWHRLTGLPFVWALWICGDEEAAGRVGPLVHRAKESGLRNLERLAREAAGETGLNERHCVSYLTHTIHYDLGPREMAGVAEFRRLWEKMRS